MFETEFLLLPLRIDKYVKGYIDFYFGPKKLRQIVDNEIIISPNKLLNDSKLLLKQLGAQGYDKARERYLRKSLTAMETSVKILNGIEIPIKEQFLRLYDVALQPVNESELEGLKEDFNNAYTGSGSLKERMAKLRVRRSVPEGKVFMLFEKALNIAKKRTQEIFVDLLPKEEKIILVKNDNKNEIRWPCYEWYLGDFHSRLEVNPNYNMYWTSFISYATHEGYCGHHTEFIVKEQRLYRELNQFEHSILLLHSPKLILSECIADLAVRMLFSYREEAEIGLQEFCPDTLKEDSLEVLIVQNKVRGKVTLFWYNFAYHALIDEWNDDELIKYAKNFEIFKEENIKNHLKVISNPMYSMNAFSYNLGNKIIRNKYGECPSVEDFRNLLVNPILPSDLV